MHVYTFMHVHLLFVEVQRRVRIFTVYDYTESEAVSLVFG